MRGEQLKVSAYVTFHAFSHKSLTFEPNPPSSTAVTPHTADPPPPMGSTLAWDSLVSVVTLVVAGSRSWIDRAPTTSDRIDAGSQAYLQNESQYANFNNTTTNQKWKKIELLKIICGC